MTARLVLATRNAHKVVELRRILTAAGAGVELVGLDAYPDLADVKETGVTFAENALLKARAVAEATGLPAVADDSGLAVDVLGGSPGVFSARWSGTHGDDLANLSLLLAQLGDVFPEHRSAHFACAAALVIPAGPGSTQDGSASEPALEQVVEGRLEGVLIEAPRGSNGFGYDPIFVPDGQPDGGTRTTAELTPDEKDAISHRGRAFRGLAAMLPELLSPVAN